jgi:hypothetical protein
MVPTTMNAVKDHAHNVLSYHSTSPEFILSLLRDGILPNIVLKDQNNEEWTFVHRHRCRFYLMAKTKDMKRFEEVYTSTFY